MPPMLETQPKTDANKEAFQMRAQWKKAELCAHLWNEKWSWLLKEDELRRKEIDALRQAAKLRRADVKHEFTKTLKPVPVTSSGFVGWLASRPDCALEIYTSWRARPPVRAPDAWDDPEYVVGKK